MHKSILATLAAAALLGSAATAPTGCQPLP